MPSTIYVQLLGNFKMTGPKGSLSDSNLRSEQLYKLLTYILSRHTTRHSSFELASALWDDDTDNSPGALKNLIYRLRTLLRKHIGDDAYILTGHETYYWNPDIPLVLDIEQFENLYRRIEQLVPENLSLCEEALALYQGDFLSKFAWTHWALSASAFYHSLYLSLVKNTAKIYAQQEYYEKLSVMVNEALILEPLDEELHYLAIYSLKMQGQLPAALAAYHHTEEVLYENLGIKPSKELQELYRSLLKETHDVAGSLDVVQKDLLEATRPEGIFVCEYGIFREIYRLQARQAQRFGMSVYIVLITLSLNKETDESTRFADLKAGMDHLLKALNHLRSGDVAAKYSSVQYVILLPTCTYETGKMVMMRVLHSFFDSAKWNRYNINYSLDEINLADS